MVETERECRNGHRVDLSRTQPGGQTECPECKRRGFGRVPVRRRKNVPAAAAPALAADNGLAEAWAAEAPYVRGWRQIPGPPGPECRCGSATRWTGAHTAVLCLGAGHDNPVWSVSPGAKDRVAEHLAAIDKTAARKSAQLADPDAERRAAEQLAADRAELLDNLDGLADDLDVSDFPRRHVDYAPARRAGIKAAGTVALYTDRARHADTLDQLRRINADAAKYAASIQPWLERIADLRHQLADDGADDDVITGEVIYDDRDDAGGYDGLDDDERDALADRVARQIREARERAMLTAPRAARPGALRLDGLRLGGLVPPAGLYCEPCKRQRRYVDGTYPLAAGRVEWPGMVPAPQDLCTDHLTAAMSEHGRALSVVEWFDAAPGGLRLAYEQARRELIGLPPLTGTEIMTYAGVRYIPPVGARRRKSRQGAR